MRKEGTAKGSIEQRAANWWVESLKGKEIDGTKMSSLCEKLSAAIGSNIEKHGFVIISTVPGDNGRVLRKAAERCGIPIGDFPYNTKMEIRDGLITVTLETGRKITI